MANPFRLPMAGQSLRNLVARPSTRLYPFTVRTAFLGARGKIEFDVETCNYCMLCARRCPTLAIRVDREARAWSIEHLSCIACNACVEVCAKKSLAMSATPRTAAAAEHGPNARRPGHEEWHSGGPEPVKPAPAAVANAAPVAPAAGAAAE
jgi:ech hydrogenase subunit F